MGVFLHTEKVYVIDMFLEFISFKIGRLRYDSTTMIYKSIIRLRRYKVSEFETVRVFIILLLIIASDIFFFVYNGLNFFYEVDISLYLL